MAKTRVLRLLRERKLADLLDPPSRGAVFEASGVIADGKYCYVVLDNCRRVARIGANLELGAEDHQWVGRLRKGEGYEGDHP